MLPRTAYCELCGGDDHDKRVKEGGVITLMECNVCFKVVHPECLRTKGQPYEGVINEDLSNSWECPECCNENSNSDDKVRKSYHHQWGELLPLMLSIDLQYDFYSILFSHTSEIV